MCVSIQHAFLKPRCVSFGPIHLHAALRLESTRNLLLCKVFLESLCFLYKEYIGNTKRKNYDINSLIASEKHVLFALKNIKS
jgi:hypothetical protein